MNSSLDILSDYEFECIRSIIVVNFGIVLSNSKKTLIISRLKDYLKKRKIKSFSSYIDILKDDKSGKEISELINRISTNHTFFFREKEHYSFFFNKALVEFEDILDREKDFRMWCAGCSYGDEPYSFQILLFEYFKDNYKKWTAGILATDISETVLKSAKEGVFNEQRIRNVPESLLSEYFVKKDNLWKISESVKKEVVFRRFNLMNREYPYRKKFHIICCRNVMIYFNEDTRNKLLEKFYKTTVNGGYLFIGRSEYIDKKDIGYRFIAPGIYKRC